VVKETSHIESTFMRIGTKAAQGTNSDAFQAETLKDLMRELSHIRGEVSREYNGLKRLSLKDNNDITDGSSQVDRVQLEKRRRILFLFVKDLSSGVSKDALSSKSERDSSLKMKALTGVSLMEMISAWVFVVLMNCGLLFYVYLFAMRQTHSRQSAWFQSFVMWLLFEVTVSSTGLVVLSHLLLPLFVLADVSKIKERVLKVLMTFRAKYLRAPRDLEEGRSQEPEEVGGSGVVVGGEGAKEFNAAKYLFVSSRVASLFQELPESRLILQFSTPWPKRKFGAKAGEVAAEYDQSIALSAVGRILLYFLGSLLRFHTLVQDILIQTVCNTGLGFLGVWLIHLFAISPALPVCVIVMLVLLLYWLLRIFSVRENEMKLRLASVVPGLDPSEDNSLAGNPVPSPLSGSGNLVVQVPHLSTATFASTDHVSPRHIVLGSESEQLRLDDRVQSEGERNEEEEEEVCMWSDGSEEFDMAPFIDHDDQSSQSENSNDSHSCGSGNSDQSHTSSDRDQMDSVYIVPKEVFE
jgi:hypothetical protein